MTLARARLSVIGLGYVGLPLAVAFGTQREVLGFDINPGRIAALQEGNDVNQDVAGGVLAAAGRLRFSCAAADLVPCNVHIISVPTPLDAQRRPDLGPLLAATAMVGAVLRHGDMVIYESTVFPGATEECCVPVLEQHSGLRLNRDFHVGYSPERISPGDAARPLSAIVKVTSGSTPDAADFVDALYRTIVTAGTHKAPSIRVAEAAKVIENIQRDVNIALMNEISVILSHLGIDTGEVLDAAATKWNFSRMTPGLVGGPCISVVPHYLLHRAEAAGISPRLIRAAREINDDMAEHAVALLGRALGARGQAVASARVLVLGATFKADCRDVRSSRVLDLVAALRRAGAQPELCDPLADAHDLRARLGASFLPDLPSEGAGYDAVVLAVPHGAYVAAGAAALRARMRPGGVFFDLMGAFPRRDSDLRL